jgi:hypothetical protein
MLGSPPIPVNSRGFIAHGEVMGRRVRGDMCAVLLCFHGRRADLNPVPNFVSGMSFRKMLVAPPRVSPKYHNRRQRACQRKPDAYKLESILMEAVSHSKHPSIPSSIDQDRHEAIRRRAEEIYIRNGRTAGRDVENWVQAEAEILREAEVHSHRAAVVIKVSGVRYVGEYSVAAAGYAPGEFAAGDPIAVRFEADKMFVTRNSGGELETTIVKRID